SGWDLIGALPLAPTSVQSLLADGDTRWINRGAYDLMGQSPNVKTSAAGLPRALSLYGSLPDHLRRKDPFPSHLNRLLFICSKYRIAESEQVEVPQVRSQGLLIMVHRLTEGERLQVTEINFGREPVHEWVTLKSARTPRKITHLLGEDAPRESHFNAGRLEV